MKTPAPLILLAALSLAVGALAVGAADAKTATKTAAKAKPAATPAKTYARPAPDPAKAAAAVDPAAKAEADCAALASQQTGYAPAQTVAAADASKGGAEATAKKGGKFLGKIPVTTLIGGPKSIAMGAATGLAGSQVAKSGGVVGDAASGAANVMGKVPIPTTQQVAGAVGVDIPGTEEEKAKAQKASWDKARAQCLQGKGFAKD